MKSIEPPSTPIRPDCPLYDAPSKGGATLCKNRLALCAEAERIAAGLGGVDVGVVVHGSVVAAPVLAVAAAAAATEVRPANG